jgi:hypothetical protein
MKKVGLVSVRNYNYGSILQAYALQQELFAAGVDIIKSVMLSSKLLEYLICRSSWQR